MEVFGDLQILKQCPRPGDLLALVRRLKGVEEIWGNFFEEAGSIGRMWGQNKKDFKSRLAGSSIPLICPEGTIYIYQINGGRGPLKVLVHRGDEQSPEFEATVQRIKDLIRENNLPYVEAGSP